MFCGREEYDLKLSSQIKSCPWVNQKLFYRSHILHKIGIKSFYIWAEIEWRWTQSSSNRSLLTIFFRKNNFQVSSPSSAQPTSALPALVFLIQMLFYDARWTQSLRCAHCNVQCVVHIAHCNVHKMCAHIASPFRNRIGHIKEPLEQFCRMWFQSCKFLRPFQSVSESCGFIGPGTFNSKASNDRMFQKILRKRFMNKNL